MGPHNCGLCTLPGWALTLSGSSPIPAQIQPDSVLWLLQGSPHPHPIASEGPCCALAVVSILPPRTGSGCPASELESLRLSYLGAPWASPPQHGCGDCVFRGPPETWVPGLGEGSQKVPRVSSLALGPVLGCTHIVLGQPGLVVPWVLAVTPAVHMSRNDCRWTQALLFLVCL